MHSFLQEQYLYGRRHAQGSAVLSQQLNVQEEMRTWHLQKIWMHRGWCEMRCGVVVEEEGNKLFAGRRFVYFGEAELHEIWQEPCQVQH